MPRGIQLSVKPLAENGKQEQAYFDKIEKNISGEGPISGLGLLPRIDQMTAVEDTTISSHPDTANSASAIEKEAPRLAFSVRLSDNFKPGEDIKDLFVEWLRNIPTIAKEVKIEACFDSFSTLLIISLPLSLLAYLPHDPSLISLGPILSGNRVLDCHSEISTSLKSRDMHSVSRRRKPTVPHVSRQLASSRSLISPILRSSLSNYQARPELNLSSARFDNHVKARESHYREPIKSAFQDDQLEKKLLKLDQQNEKRKEMARKDQRHSEASKLDTQGNQAQDRALFGVTGSIYSTPPSSKSSSISHELLPYPKTGGENIYTTSSAPMTISKVTSEDRVLEAVFIALGVALDLAMDVAPDVARDVAMYLGLDVAMYLGLDVAIGAGGVG
jgi:hypothetical protein